MRAVALYDLSRYPANFNFVEFLVAAATRGARHVLFDASRGYRPKFDPKETAKRMRSILEPACALAGCTFAYGGPQEGCAYCDPGYHYDALLEALRDCGSLRLLAGTRTPGTARYTVTLRTSGRYPKRNSNESAWRGFAERIGAAVIEDYARAPIALADRMALYEGAEMNFGVGNGPMALCLLSRAPYLIFHKAPDADYHARHGFPVGSQYPWALAASQRLVWQDDSRENIERAWEEMRWCVDA